MLASSRHVVDFVARFHCLEGSLFHLQALLAFRSPVSAPCDALRLDSDNGAIPFSCVSRVRSLWREQHERTNMLGSLLPAPR